MDDLKLKFRDVDGSERVVEPASSSVTIGRHSGNDVAIGDGRLSREHLIIENDDGEWYVQDLGSSNGTFVNGERISGGRRIKDGDTLSLGGFEMAVVVGAKAAPPAVASAPAAGAPAAPASVNPPQPHPPVLAGSRVSSEGGIPKLFFIIAPAMGLIVLLLIGGVLYFGRDKGSTNIAEIDTTDPDPVPTRTRKDDDTPQVNSAAPTPDSQPSNDAPPSPTPDTSGTSRIETNAAAFLRKAAQNDRRAFLTGDQAKIVDGQIRSMSGSIAGNLASARKSASDLRTLAASKNLKPDLLTAAALAKLGNSQGDVLATARSMADVLDRLSIQVGSELADDCLLMIAAYSQGASGDFMKMRNMLQDVATHSNAPVREIRSIWYLQKQNRITSAEYDMAIKFLAAGTIMQNPKAFGVNSEAVTF